MTVRFIPDDLVFIIHEDLLQRYGGMSGIRDRNLHESALAQPRMTIGSAYVHKTLIEKAAAYCYHICSNHPFIDGNKRLAFVLMDVFLGMNGREIHAGEEEVYSMMIDLAAGKLTKPKLVSWLKKHSVPVRRSHP